MILWDVSCDRSFQIFFEKPLFNSSKYDLDKRHVMFSRGLLLILLQKLCMINIYVDRS